MSGLYWKEGIDATPPLDKYVTSEVENILSLESTLDKTYDGKAVNGPVVKAGDKVLAEGTDYTLTYKDSEGNELSETPVNAGTYTVTVNGLGTYAGMNLNVTFTISPKAAELTVVADPSSAKYDGKSKTPEVTVKDGDKVLKEGTDYTLSYVYGEDAETKDFAGVEFVKEGNYTITVTGIGNYEGSTGKAVFTISKIILHLQIRQTLQIQTRIRTSQTKKQGYDSQRVIPSLNLSEKKEKRWLMTTIFLSVTCYNVTMLTNNYYNDFFLKLGNRKLISVSSN